MTTQKNLEELNNVVSELNKTLESNRQSLTDFELSISKDEDSVSNDFVHQKVEELNNLTESVR